MLFSSAFFRTLYKIRQDDERTRAVLEQREKQQDGAIQERQDNYLHRMQLVMERKAKVCTKWSFLCFEI